ncbi:hypothetical protein CVT26_005488 [Gymnopilus dilepis]|uniref:Uncharacterized protein n=1 Tax=Gymnopilus dilepis TaxID=231916 RepID=A0A409WJJ8_9AGAR|nr:hypothetical protein CVT26_005488 [Gymnopilus dilepis]
MDTQSAQLRRGASPAILIPQHGDTRSHRPRTRSRAGCSARKHGRDEDEWEGERDGERARGVSHLLFCREASCCRWTWASQQTQQMQELEELASARAAVLPLYSIVGSAGGRLGPGLGLGGTTFFATSATDFLVRLPMDFILSSGVGSLPRAPTTLGFFSPAAVEETTDDDPANVIIARRVHNGQRNLHALLEPLALGGDDAQDADLERGTLGGVVEE